MKKLIALLLALVMVVGLVACGARKKQLLPLLLRQLPLLPKLLPKLLLKRLLPLTRLS